MEAWPKREAFDDRGPAVPWELPANRRHIRRSGEACFFQAARHSRVASCRRASALDSGSGHGPQGGYRALQAAVDILTRQEGEAMRDLWSGTYNEPAYWDETATALISMAELRPGSAVLDVGTGYGGTLFRALDRIGGAGRIVGIDVEAECVDWTKKEVAKRAISNAEILLMNARSMSFPDTGFDVVIAGMVGLDEDYDFSAGKTIDGAPMMREIFRVLKPGGRLFISGWLWQEHLEWMGELVRRYLPGCERRGYSPATEEGATRSPIQQPGWRP